MGNFFSDIGKSVKKVTRAIGRLGGNDKYGNYSAWGLSPSEKSMAHEQELAQQAAEREARRKAHEEEVLSLALGAEEMLKNRRRKGQYSTILTGGTPQSYASPRSLGTPPVPLARN